MVDTEMCDTDEQVHFVSTPLFEIFGPKKMIFFWARCAFKLYFESTRSETTGGTMNKRGINFENIVNVDTDDITYACKRVKYAHRRVYVSDRKKSLLIIHPFV